MLLFSSALFIRLETRDSCCILSTSNLYTLHSTFFSLFYLCQMTCVCLYTTLIFLKLPFPLQCSSKLSSADLGEVPSVKHSSLLPVSFAHTLLSTKLYFVYVCSFLLGCAFFKDSNCVSPLTTSIWASAQWMLIIRWTYTCFHLLFLHSSMFFTSPFVSMCGHPLKFDCCKALPQSKWWADIYVSSVLWQILGYSIHWPSFSVSEMFDSFL